MRPTTWLVAGALIMLLLTACSPVANSAATPSQPAAGWDAASSGLCQAVAALPDQAAAERAFTNLAHDHLHALAADPRLDRSLAAKILEAMQAVEVDLSRPSDVAVLTGDLAALRDTTDAALHAIGVELRTCTE